MARQLGAMILMAILSAGSYAAQSGLPDLTVPDCIGVNIHFTGAQREQVDMIADAGFKFVRMDFHWASIEKNKGEYDFAAYDELVDSLATRNIRALFILDYGNPLYDDNLAPHTDEGRAAFARFAAAGAAHFKGKGVLWELWNEPNGGFWRPQANVDDYVKWAITVYRALKKADPTCTVLAPALAGWDTAFLDSAFKQGLLGATDVVSLHPYGSAKPEDAAILYAKTRELIAKYAKKGASYPIVSGEWGYSSWANGVSLETQADFIARQFLSNMASGVRLSIWYDWRDDGLDPNENEHHFGTVYNDLKPKPAYIAVRTLTTELGGYSFANRISGASPEDHLLLFRKGDSYRLAAWTVGDPHTISLPVDVKQVEIVSRSGERTKADINNGRLELKLTNSPQYVEPVGASTRWALEAAWNVEAGTALTDSGLQVKVKSVVNGYPLPNAVVSVSGAGVERASINHKTQATAVSGDARSEISFSTRYEYTGESQPLVTVTLLPDGMTEPIVRVVELDKSACPIIEVLPSTGKQVQIAVRRPATGSKGRFVGRLVLGNADGIQLERYEATVDLAPSEDKTVIHFKAAQASAAFSFACKLVDKKGNDIVRVPAGRFVIVESFADGRPGETVTKYGVRAEGDAKVAGEGKLTYVKAPEGAPEDVCAKLDYSFEEGWKYLCVSQAALIPIEGKPRCARMWIKGDGQGAARLRLEDAGKETFQPDYGSLNFADWRCLEADLTGAHCGHWGGKNTGRIEYPIKWETLFLFDNTARRKTRGTIYLGPVMLYYD